MDQLGLQRDVFIEMIGAKSRVKWARNVERMVKTTPAKKVYLHD